jgi:hypothetical protein
MKLRFQIMRYFLIFFLLVISFIRVTGQETEKKTTYVPSPDTASIFYTQINDRWPGEKLTRLNDSILTGFQYFLPTEHETSLNALTGNAGLAYHSMVFDATPEYSGFRYTPFDYIDYKWINHKIRYFQTTGPYSNLFYSTGPGKEQLFNVTHSQNIAGGLTLGIDVMIVNSLGLYERQKSDNVSFAGTAQFISKKENYVVLGNYHNSRFRWRENGGVSKLSLFTNNVETDRSRIPIYLKNADNLQKESGFQIRQFYYFGKLKDNPVTDSLISDTIGPKKLHRYYDPYRSNFIRHTISYSQNADSYKDPSPNSGYYDRILIDSTKTMDSLYYQELLNDVSFEAGVGKVRGSSKAILLRIGIEHAAGVYKTDTIKKTFNRLTTYAYLSANAFGYAKAEGRIWTTTGAPFNGDKGLSGTLTLPGYDNRDKWGNLVLNADLTIEQPFYFYQYHYSNHFSWDNAFGQQTTLSLKSSYEHRYFKAGFNLFNLNDYVYLDENSLPKKEDGAVTVSQIWMYTDVRLRYIESQIYGVLQNSSNSDVISLPQFAGRMSLYFTHPLFKRALHFQAGVTALYNTSFYEDAYMPALRSFYVQHTIKTGNYPYLDAFINIRVKRARLYLVMKHFNMGMGNYDYIMIPNYPMPDRGLRFGISWAFYD